MRSVGTVLLDLFLVKGAIWILLGMTMSPNLRGVKRALVAATAGIASCARRVVVFKWALDGLEGELLLDKGTPYYPFIYLTMVVAWRVVAEGHVGALSSQHLTNAVEPL